MQQSFLEKHSQLFLAYMLQYVYSNLRLIYYIYSMKNHIIDKLYNVQLPDFIYSVIRAEVTNPIAGFEHKKDANGNYLSRDDQLRETREQLILIAKSQLARGASVEDVLRIINYFKNK